MCAEYLSSQNNAWKKPEVEEKFLKKFRYIARNFDWAEFFQTMTKTDKNQFSPKTISRDDSLLTQSRFWRGIAFNEETLLTPLAEKQI